MNEKREPAYWRGWWSIPSLRCEINSRRGWSCRRRRRGRAQRCGGTTLEYLPRFSPVSWHFFSILDELFLISSLELHCYKKGAMPSRFHLVELGCCYCIRMVIPSLWIYSVVERRKSKRVKHNKMWKTSCTLQASTNNTPRRSMNHLSPMQLNVIWMCNVIELLITSILFC